MASHPAVSSVRGAPILPTAVSVSPTVSVVLPTFNRLEYLRPAVESVFAQTFTAWELLIGDDGSEAETLDYLAALAARPRVKVLRFRHTGNPAVVRNATMREARGEYIAFPDSDDLRPQGHLALRSITLEAGRSDRGPHPGSCVDAHVDRLLSRTARVTGIK
jgi:glycosyltransferase involved in cell wall biosynthesis